MTAWHVGRMVGYDLESTGIDPLTARIVTAAIVHTAPGQRPSTIQWLLDPGIDVPAEAAAVHGWSRSRILEQVGEPVLGERMAVRITAGPDRENRMPMTVDGALGEIAGHLALAMKADIPVVIANAAYDMTLTETELSRVGIDTLTSRPTGICGVVDPMVLERQWDPYRKTKTGCRGGKYRCEGCGVTDRKLGSLCTHYGIRLVGAHSAGGDALAAVRLATKLASLWPDVARLRLPTLHSHQVAWRAEQMASLESYHRRMGVADGDYDQGWPVHTRLAALQGVA
jgi:DNA polymerase III subunit epsilon